MFSDSEFTGEVRITSGFVNQLVEKIANAIVNDKPIFESEYFSESEIAKKYHSSRTVAREAVKILTNKGLIRSRQKKGAYVLPKASWHWFDQDIIRWSLDSKDALATYRDFVELRVSIEPEAAAIVAERRSSSELDSLRKILVELESSTRGLAGCDDSMLKFNAAIVYFAGNRIFQSYRGLLGLPALNRYCNMLTSKTVQLENAREIYSAIATRNPDLTRQLVRKGFLRELRVLDQKSAASLHSSFS